MPVRVVDASALGALLFGEPEAERIADALEGARLIAPSLLWFELASVCLKKVHALPRRAVGLLAAFERLDRFAIDAIDIDHGEAIALARALRLTTYDASYLWLARRTGADLVTLDTRLGRAARARSDR
jgi:predicted nucleic acid-binding protein